jgi:mRNA-degrading endonuclease RelE of RelBE toxin-antitoxin system
LAGLWKYKVRRFRIVYEIRRKKRMVKIFAIGHRREVGEELAEQFSQLVQRRK